MNTTISKTAIWLARGIMVTFIIAFIMLAVTVHKQNRKIKEYEEAITEQTEMINRLWGEECVTVNVACYITQKGLVNTTASNQISKSVATYTRGQMLMAIDSLHRTADTTQQ